MGGPHRLRALLLLTGLVCACDRPSVPPESAAAGGDTDVAADSVEAGKATAEHEAGVERGEVVPEAEPPVEAWHEPVAEREPATDAARTVVETLAEVEEKLTETRYQYVTVVRERTGVFRWDCSGMVAWVLDRAAPRALDAVHTDRPLARDFYDVIADSPTDDVRRGWQRLAGPEDIAPGDLFAWRKPDFWAERPNTGHVGFVIGTPQPHPDHENVWVMRVADATKMLHEADSRPEDGEGGFGTATMAFQFDAQGVPVAYGWYGASQPPETFVPTTIAFGRVSR